MNPWDIILVIWLGYMPAAVVTALLIALNQRPRKGAF